MNTLKSIIGLLLIAGLVGALLPARSDRLMGSYVTSLESRTAGQRANALLAASAIDGVIIEGGHVFSFNRTVGPWTADRGYVRAPVSFEGELVKDWGGGVCQTSTTLYNAALLAGLSIVERHRHTWAPTYAPPGRDAAVAQYDVDLRIRNPYPWPVRLTASVKGSALGFEVTGRLAGPVAAVEAVRTGASHPMEIVRASERIPAGRSRIITRGKPGARVAVYRLYVRGPRAGTRELVSRDSYPAMNRVVALGAEP